ncbi:hypothetical protein D3C76_512100 [compost metagenome]
MPQQVMADPAVGDCQVDAAQHQFAEVGFMGRRGFAPEMYGLVERGTIGVAG